MLHFVDVGAQGLRFWRLAEQSQLELETRQNGPEVVADAGKHRRALVDMRLDPVTHFQEGLSRLAHLAGAAGTEVFGHGAALAEFVGRIREPQDGADLVAQKQDRHGEQDHRSADHPQQEDVGVRRVSLRAGGDEAQDRVVMLDTDLDVARLADGVDPERPVDALADLVGQRSIEQAEERLRARFRQVPRWQNLQRQTQLVTRQFDDRCLGCLTWWRLLVDLDECCDVACGGFRQTTGDGLPVTLHEDEGDDTFEHDDRCDDDYECAGVKALGHDVGDPLERISQTAPDACAHGAQPGCGANAVASAFLGVGYVWRDSHYLRLLSPQSDVLSEVARSGPNAGGCIFQSV